MTGTLGKDRKWEWQQRTGDASAVLTANATHVTANEIETLVKMKASSEGKREFGLWVLVIY